MSRLIAAAAAVQVLAGLAAAAVMHDANGPAPRPQSPWRYYGPLLPPKPAQSDRVAEDDSLADENQPREADRPRAEHYFGYPTHQDALFDDGNRPEWQPQHVPPPDWNRPAYERPDYVAPLWSQDPIRRPVYHDPLREVPDDDRPRYQIDNYLLPSELMKHSFLKESYTDRPDYQIRPIIPPAQDRPDYDRESIGYPRPQYQPPTDAAEEYRPPRYFPPPYIPVPR